MKFRVSVFIRHSKLTDPISCRSRSPFSSQWGGKFKSDGQAIFDIQHGVPPAAGNIHNISGELYYFLHMTFSILAGSVVVRVLLRVPLVYSQSGKKGFRRGKEKPIAHSGEHRAGGMGVFIGNIKEKE